MSAPLHPKVKATGVAGAASVVLAEILTQLGFTPGSPELFWPAVTVLLSFAAGWRA